MKKLLLSLCLTLLLSLFSSAETTTYSFTTKTNTGVTDNTGGKWTNGNPGLVGSANFEAATFGGSGGSKRGLPTNQAGSITSDNEFKNVTKIVVDASANGNKTPLATLEIKVGDNIIGEATSVSKANHNLYNFESTTPFSGKITISVTKPGEKHVYIAGVQLTTKDIDPNLNLAELAFEQSEYTATLGDESFVSPQLVKQLTDGEVTYYSSNPTVATIDTKTAKLTLVSGGTTTITAKSAETETYAAGVASYELTVVDPNAPFEFTSALGQEFTFENPASLEIWKHDSTYGLKGTAYINSTTNAAEAIAASPLLDLTRYKDITLDFQNAFNNYKKGGENIAVEDFAGYAYVVVKEEGETEWTEVCEATAPTSFSWTFFDNAQIDLSAYSNKKIQFGFKYVSTADVAGTWEIKNIELRGVVGQAKTPAGLSFGEQTEFTVEEGGDFTAPELINPNGLNVTITSSDEDVAYAELDGEDLIVIIGKHGTATITATSEETDQFAAGKAGFTITVTEKQKTPVTLSFDKAEFSGYAGEMFEAGLPVLTKTADVEVIYTSSDENVVEIDSEGTILNLVAAGTATITASFDGNDTYNSTSASYTVTVLPGLGDITVNGDPWQEEVTVYVNNTIVFAAENAAKIAYVIEGNDGEVENSNESSSIAWMPTETGDYMVTVTATLGSLSKEELCAVSVLAKPAVTPQPAGEWTKVTSADDFATGFEYVVTSQGSYTVSKVPYNFTYAMSKNANGDVLQVVKDAKEVSIDEDGNLTLNSSDAAIMTVEPAENGKYYFNCDGNYLYVSARNKAQFSSTDKSACAITIDGNSVKITATIGNTSYNLQANPNSGNNERFAFYSSAQKPIAVYYRTPAVLPEHPSILVNGTAVDMDMEYDLQNSSVTITLTAPEGHHIYHKHVAAGSTENVRAKVVTDDGYTVVENNVATIEVNTSGTLYFHSLHPETGLKSDTQALTFVGGTTSIEEISDAAATSAAEIFDLQGRRVTTAPRRGLYIIKQGSKVSKRAL